MNKVVGNHIRKFMKKLTVEAINCQSYSTKPTSVTLNVRADQSKLDKKKYDTSDSSTNVDQKNPLFACGALTRKRSPKYII